MFTSHPSNPNVELISTHLSTNALMVFESRSISEQILFPSSHSVIIVPKTFTPFLCAFAR